jgi:hypothetical protein
MLLCLAIDLRFGIRAGGPACTLIAVVALAARRLAALRSPAPGGDTPAGARGRG